MEKRFRSSSNRSPNLVLNKKTKIDVNDNSQYNQQHTYINNIYGRIIYFTSIKKIFSTIINKCIIVHESQLYLNDYKIIIKKQIGSKSVYGTIFNVNINNKNGALPLELAIKLIPELPRNKELINNEIEVLKKCTIEVLKKRSINLPIMYNDIYCETPDVSIMFPENINNKKYHILYMELENGDLDMFYNESKPIDFKILKNAFIQIILSIYTLHMLGYSHNDAHSRNFFYRKINPGGYIYYKINDQDYYLENLGYIWIIADFGTCERLNEKYFNDYIRILEFFKNEKDRGKINDSIKFEEDFSEIIFGIEDSINQFRNEKKFINNILEIIKNDNILIREIDTNKIINKEPYNINIRKSRVNKLRNISSIKNSS
jgi:hypothetical protein